MERFFMFGLIKNFTFTSSKWSWIAQCIKTRIKTSETIQKVLLAKDTVENLGGSNVSSRENGDRESATSKLKSQREPGATRREVLTWTTSGVRTQTNWSWNKSNYRLCSCRNPVFFSWPLLPPAALEVQIVPSLSRRLWLWCSAGKKLQIDWLIILASNSIDVGASLSRTTDHSQVASPHAAATWCCGGETAEYHCFVELWA